MKVRTKSIGGMMLLLGLGICTQSAMAGCGAIHMATAHVKLMAYRSGDSPDRTAGGLLQLGPFVTSGLNGSRFDTGHFIRTAAQWDHQEPSVVGMWRFELIAPNGTMADDGYAQWHADGTEIQNSGVHAPMTSNFCLGVWEQVAPNTYKLNHFPLAWDSTGQASSVAIRLTETVKLTDENHMIGSFTMSVYPWDSTKGLDVLGPAVQTLTGTVTAQRVTIASTVPGAP